MIYLNIFGSGKLGSLQMDFLEQALVRPPPKLGIRGKQKVHIFHWWGSRVKVSFFLRDISCWKWPFFKRKTAVSGHPLGYIQRNFHQQYHFLSQFQWYVQIFLKKIFHEKMENFNFQHVSTCPPFDANISGTAPLGNLIWPDLQS